MAPSRIKGRFAMIPRDVWLSEACRTLPYYARVVLIAIAFQYAGKNNGDLSMPWSVALTFGVRSKEHLVDSLRLLLERGLILKTRQGGKRPLGPTLYALTWLPIDDLGNKIDMGPTRHASNDWEIWSSAPPGDQARAHRDCRRGRAAIERRDCRRGRERVYRDCPWTREALYRDCRRTRDPKSSGLPAVLLLYLIYQGVPTP
jgi:hypothetical protein